MKYRIRILYGLSAVVAAALVAALAGAGPARSAGEAGRSPSGKGRLVAVADVHGDLPAFLGILQTAGLIDADRRWIGGEATLVQTGDFLDRGPDVRGVMDLMMDLEGQAARAGGRVVVLLGNHEGMNLTREFRDVSLAAFATFADEDSQRRREDAYAEYCDFVEGLSKDQTLVRAGVDPPLLMPKDAWMQKYPRGYFEYVDAFDSRGRYGRWLRQKDAAARIDGILFVHGGVNPDFSPDRFEDLNRDVRGEIARFDEIRHILSDERLARPWFAIDDLIDVVNRELLVMKAEGRRGPRSPADPRDIRGFQAIVDLARAGTWNLFDQDRPLWFRGFASWTEEEGTPLVTALLKRYEADHFAVGHTVVNRMASRFGGRVFVMDTGMLTSVYRNGTASALEVENGRFTAVYPDRREHLWPPAASASAPGPATAGAQ